MQTNFEELSVRLDGIYIEAARHGIESADTISASVYDGTTAVFKCSAESGSHVISPETSAEDEALCLKIFASRTDVRCILLMTHGYAARLAKDGRRITEHSHLYYDLFPSGVPLHPVSDGIFQTKSKAALVLGKGAYILAGNPAEAVENAVALEYVAKIGEVTELIRGK